MHASCHKQVYCADPGQGCGASRFMLQARLHPAEAAALMPAIWRVAASRWLAAQLDSHPTWRDAAKIRSLHSDPSACEQLRAYATDKDNLVVQACRDVR